MFLLHYKQASKQERLKCPKQLNVTAQALYNHKAGEGYEMLNRWVLSRDRKTAWFYCTSAMFSCFLWFIYIITARRYAECG